MPTENLVLPSEDLLAAASLQDVDASVLFSIFGIFGIGFFVFLSIVIVFYIIVLWRIFTKAGEAGRKSLIPFYNWYVFTKVCGRPARWFFLSLGLYVVQGALSYVAMTQKIESLLSVWQIAGFIVAILQIVLLFDLAKRFNKGTGFAIWLLLLNIIFMPMLAFGDAVYTAKKEETNQPEIVTV